MKKKVIIFFKSAWLSARRDDRVYPPDAFLQALEGHFGIKGTRRSFFECEFFIEDNSADNNKAGMLISFVLNTVFSVTNIEDAVEYSVESAVADTDTVKDTERVKTILERIDFLVGAEEFKELAHECAQIASGLLKYNTVAAFTCRCYLFSINTGNGLTTALRLFAELLDSLDLFKFKDENCIVEAKLPPFDSKTGADPFEAVLSYVRRFNNASKRLISIDISEWMTCINDKRFRDFLLAIDKSLGDNLIIFNIPYVEQEVLGNIRDGLSDVLYIRCVSFVPFDNSELVRCAELELKKFLFTMDEDARDILRARIIEEKSDGRFYGLNTIRKIVLEMLYLKQLHDSRCARDDNVIKKEDIAELAVTYKIHEKSGMELLEKYVGMEDIKKRICEITAQIEAGLKNPNIAPPCIHMRFVGNPGTGKTTVARVIGKILQEKGILRNGNFFEYSGRDFCGRYVGETAPKTAAICRDAYGSVLFIDEAYSLYRDTESSVDYGREAIDTLIAEMENHRTDLVVIMAGYKKEMECLMEANDGLESRMPYVIEFPNYTKEQLYEIFMKMVDQSFGYREGFEETVRAFFEGLGDELLNSERFSNARYVRNLFERTWGKAALRAQINKEDILILTKEDFESASSEKEFADISPKRIKRPIGFN